MRDRRLQLALVAGTAASLGLLWFTGVPLGVPGEWEWERFDVREDALDVLLGALAAFVAAAIYIGLVWLGVRRLGRCSRIEAAAWLALLVTAGFFWLFFAQETPPAGMSRAAWVLYYPHSSGYFTKARYEMEDPRSFLAGYEQMIAEADRGERVLHVGTHPPGLFLFHRVLLDACRRSPALTQVLLRTQPHSVSEAFDFADRRGRLKAMPLDAEDRASLWLAALLTQLVAVAALVPLYLLLRRQYARPASWIAASFWPLVPALAVFLPKSDALYPFLGCLFLWLWLEGAKRAGCVKALCRRTASSPSGYLMVRLRRALTHPAGLCIAAGFVLWLGLYLSLALLPVALLGAIVALWESREAEGEGGPLSASDRFPIRLTPGLCAAAGCAALGFLAPVAAMWAVFEINLVNVWIANYFNHAEFYDYSPRTYWKWLLVNPLELVLAAGVPLALLAAISFRSALAAAGGWRARSLAPYGGCAAVWLLLWFSGKNSGEAARLWLVLLPWLAWLAAARLECSLQKDGASRLPLWLLALALQAAVCIATVALVNGFPVPAV